MVDFPRQIHHDCGMFMLTLLRAKLHDYRITFSSDNILAIRNHVALIAVTGANDANIQRHTVLCTEVERSLTWPVDVCRIVCDFVRVQCICK